MWEKLGGGESAAVQVKCFGVSESDNVDSVTMRSDSVCKNWSDKNRRGTEFGVVAFSGEQVQRRFIFELSSHVRVFCTISSEPVLHLVNQLQPNTFSPALTTKIVRVKDHAINLAATKVTYGIVNYGVVYGPVRRRNSEAENVSKLGTNGGTED